MTSVIGVVFDQSKKKVLLVKRRDVPVWTLPGGGVENEKSSDAIVREIFEETGLHVEVIRKVGEYTPLNRLARFTHLYECRMVSGKINTSDETREVAFFALNEVPLMPPPYQEWIDDALLEKDGIIYRKLTSVNYLTFCKLLVLHPILVGRFLLSRLGLHCNSSQN